MRLARDRRGNFVGMWESGWAGSRVTTSGPHDHLNGSESGQARSARLARPAVVTTSYGHWRSWSRRGLRGFWWKSKLSKRSLASRSRAVSGASRYRASTNLSSDENSYTVCEMNPGLAYGEMINSG